MWASTRCVLVVLTPNELRQQMGFDTHPDGDRLAPQAVGGRPEGTGDGEGDALPALRRPMVPIQPVLKPG
jgi:hypothetical protein